ncbi:hypothetical protein [Chondromyces crocatus]|uniref:Cytochrome c domain-containing protein n=1 Tax=Chondromyces crocatus TaxID=52 RepID=A0A0K1EE54_CHOCO|nr:hypothetical protein [Chondromyces crocatus]AKT39124.1 uncharacterized protein CMC5_032710 [Chondromyces crocatus]
MRTSNPYMARYAFLLPALAAAVGLTLSATSGCTGTIGGAPGEGGSGADNSSGSSSEGAGASSSIDLKGYFETNVEPLMMSGCDVCHKANGSSSYYFMAPAPDSGAIYDTVRNWNAFVIKDWERSRLLVHSTRGGPHTGTPIEDVEGLRDHLETWLKAESDAMEASVPDPAIPLVGPFAVRVAGAFNAVRFDTYLGDTYLGIGLTFTAAVNDANELVLENITVNTTTTLGVELSNPQVQVFQAGKGATIPANPYGGYSRTVLAGDSEPFEPSSVAIPNYTNGMQIGILFGSLKPSTDVGGTDCVEQALFESAALGQIQTNCATAACHGGNASTASVVMNLVNPQGDPEKTCRIIKARTDKVTPANSQIFRNSDPAGGANHPFNFNGDAAMFEQFRTAVLPWVEAEAAASP